MQNRTPISPEKKAAVVADLALGMGIREAAKKHHVNKSSVGRWAAEIDATRDREGQQGTLADVRANRFDVAVDKFLHSTLNMLQAWADVCSEPAFIRDKPSSVNELGQTILNRADRLVDAIARDTGTANEQRAAELPRVVQNNDTE